MVGLNTDGPSRDRVMRLIQEKDRIEAEIREETAVLESNNIGMTEPLVDGEGYPRGDIDVYKVRHSRHRIICLQNDHKALMRRIEQGLADVHAELLGSRREGSASNVGAAASPNVHMNGDSHTNGYANGYSHTNGHANGYGQGNSHAPRAELIQENVANGSSHPIAVVGVVEYGSPAEFAGLKQNDQILQFGTLNHSNFSDISQIQNIVVHSVGQAIQVHVKRQNNLHNLVLVPRTWSRPGLLGCRISGI